MPRPDPDPDPVPVPVPELELVSGAVVGGGGVGETVVVGGLLLDLEKLLLRIPERSEAEGDDDGEERFSRVLDLSSLPESWALALALVEELTLGSGCGRSASVGGGGTQKQQAEHAPPGRRCGSDALAGERQAGTRPEQECWDGSGDEAGGRQRPRGEQQQQQWGFRKNDGREQAQQATSRRSGPGTARRTGLATAARRTTTTRAGAFCVD